MSRQPAMTAIAAILRKSLPDYWRAKADEVRPYNSGAAHAFEECARALEERDQARGDEALTLAQAEAESGYSADHLRHLVSAGQVPNAGRRGSPRIKRADLPRKPGRVAGSSYDPSADALSLVTKRGA